MSTDPKIAVPVEQLTRSSRGLIAADAVYRILDSPLDAESQKAVLRLLELGWGSHTGTVLDALSEFIDD